MASIILIKPFFNQFKLNTFEPHKGVDDFSEMQQQINDLKSTTFITDC